MIVLKVRLRTESSKGVENGLEIIHKQRKEGVEDIDQNPLANLLPGFFIYYRYYYHYYYYFAAFPVDMNCMKSKSCDAEH